MITKVHDDPYLLWQEKYSDLPFEVVYKQDILRLGIAFDENSFTDTDYKKKDYFIFTFDRVPLESMRLGENWKAPEEIRISGGPHGLLPTVISVRINPESPYKVGVNEEGILSLFLNGSYIANVLFPPIPEYYNHDYNLDKPVGEIAPAIEWGYLLYLTVFRNCQYFGKDEECQYCDINHNWRQQKRSGRPYTGVKSIEQLLEALSGVDKFDTTAKAYTLTGGSVLTSLKGMNEVDFYLQYAEAINKKFPSRWISKIVTQAWEKEDCQKAKDVGVQIYHPNYEVWSPELFPKICPGKERFIGRDTWIRRIVESAKVFGGENVIPNFVAGVEMAQPYGFTDFKEAVDSSSEGLEYFMSQGIAPRFTTWCPEPYTPLGSSEPAPVEYYLYLLQRYRDIHAKYALPTPPGYGPPGAGNAVFSVSAFMDVLPA
ncbi:MAG: radical SAM protein [Leptospiraceae bacterium]|nr:radical SAM protein [Leptospiraceae bacterium]